MYCFCDDSGKESETKNTIVVMAGYLFPNMAALPPFEAHWKALLLRLGISWMHLKDFMQDQGEYAQFANDWPRKKATLEAFSNIIKITQPVGFGIGLDAEAWRKIPRSIRKKQGDAQMFCFTRMMKLVTDRMTIAAPRDSVALVFDCDMTFAAQRFQRFIHIRKEVPSAALHLEAFTIAEPKRYLQLQAADMLAWQTRKAMERNFKGLPARPDFDHFFEEIAGIIPEYVGEEWTAQKLEEDLVKPLMASGDYEPDLPTETV
jgi:hypothetical protein